jgi:hypothetical protein
LELRKSLIKRAFEKPPTTFFRSSTGVKGQQEATWSAMAMAMTPETETAAAWDAHPYYQLLPSYVSRSSIEAERRVLFQRVEVRVSVMRRLAGRVKTLTFSLWRPTEPVRPLGAHLCGQ